MNKKILFLIFLIAIFLIIAVVLVLISKDPDVTNEKEIDSPSEEKVKDSPGIGDIKEVKIEIDYYAKIDGDIRYGYITDETIGIGGRRGNMLGFFDKEGTFKKGVSFPNVMFTAIKGKNNLFAIGDLSVIGFEVYNTDGVLRLSKTPENQSGISAVFITDNLIGFGTGKICEKGNFYLYEIESDKIILKKNYQVDTAIATIFTNNDIIGIGFSESAWGCGSNGFTLLDLEGNFLWEKTTEKIVNVIRIFNNKIIIGGGIGLKAYNKQGDLLWEKDIYVDSLDANEKIIAAYGGDKKIYVYDYSGKLLFSKEPPGNSMVIGDFAQSVCVNSKIIVFGGNKGLRAYDYFGNLLLDYKTENNDIVYSLHCSEEIIGAGFGSGGYHLFKIK